MKAEALWQREARQLLERAEAARNDALEAAASRCAVVAQEHLTARDALLEHNPAGALTRARQAQTALELEKIIRSLKSTAGDADV